MAWKRRRRRRCIDLNRLQVPFTLLYVWMYVCGADINRVASRWINGNPWRHLIELIVKSIYSLIEMGANYPLTPFLITGSDRSCTRPDRFGRLTSHTSNVSHCLYVYLFLTTRVRACLPRVLMAWTFNLLYHLFAIYTLFLNMENKIIKTHSQLITKLECRFGEEGNETRTSLNRTVRPLTWVTKHLNVISNSKNIG